VDIEGRCSGCWGPTAGLIDAGPRWIRLECRLCGRHVLGEDAAREVERMEREAEANLAKVRVGRAAVYREDARFVLKIVPDMDRDRDRFERRVTAALAAGPKKNHLGRRDLLAPRGLRSGHRDDDAEYAVAGFLYGQASALVSGLSALPDEISAIDLQDFDFEKREITSVEAPSPGELRFSGTVPYRRPTEEVVMTRMGTAWITGMSAAFACEVGMKAILVTRLDEMEKTHDLWKLYGSLPDDSRARLEGDFPGIVDGLKENRHTFGRWRYFEGEALTHAMQGLVNEDRVRGLGKAARVIVDECVVAGLHHDHNVRYEYDIQTTGLFNEDIRPVVTCGPSHSIAVEGSFGGSEAPIPWDAIMALDPKART